MAKTPTVERETATFRLPATLLERARREGASPRAGVRPAQSRKPWRSTLFASPPADGRGARGRHQGA